MPGPGGKSVSGEDATRRSANIEGPRCSRMPKDEKPGALLAPLNGVDEAESQSLLSGSTDEEDIIVHRSLPPPPPPPAPAPTPPLNSRPRILPRQPSISLPSPDGQRRPPRTTNRVRFDLEQQDEDSSSEHNDRDSNSHGRRSQDSWLDEEDYESGRRDSSGSGRRGPMVPLLTDIEAPSVTLATTDDFFPEEYLEDARPRSGMRMAFMNMANSIIGAGIIGQPYALRQAGMLMGITLLIVLTITVDWTIRLIVINSKLSGADSYQATLQHCFGKSGLIAISIAQWVFAFGGMVAFCIIVGDTIPHVISALIPSLRDMPFLWLFTDRRAVIAIFVLGVSYPLSLYRDIAKVRLPPCAVNSSVYELMNE